MAGNGMKPSALANVVPGTDEAMRADALQASLKFNPSPTPTPQPEAVPMSPQPAVVSEEDEFAAADQALGVKTAKTEEEEFAQADANLGVKKESLADQVLYGDIGLGARKMFLGKDKVAADERARKDPAQQVEDVIKTKVGLASTEEGKLKVLQDSYPGADVYPIEDGNYRVKTKDGSQFVLNKTGEFHLGDVGKFVSDAAGIAVAVGAEALAAPVIAGVGIANPIAAASLAGGIAATADKFTRDSMAKIAGVPSSFDGSGNQILKDYGTNAALGATFGGALKYGGSKLAKSAATDVLASEGSSKAGSIVQREVKATMGELDRLNAEGILPADSALPNGVLTPDEIAKHGNLDSSYQEVRGSRVVNDFLKNRVEALQQGFDKIGKLIGVSDSAENVGNKVRQKFVNSLDMDGTLIGDFRKKVLSTSSKTTTPINNTMEALSGAENSLAEEMGLTFSTSSGVSKNQYRPGVAGKLQITDASGELVDASVDNVAKSLHERNLVSSVEDGKKFAQDLLPLVKSAQGGEEISLSKLESMRQQFANGAKLNFNSSNTKLGSLYNRMKSTLDDDLMAGIERQLPEQDIPRFLQAKQDYGSLKDAQKTLQGFLNKNDTTAKEFIKEATKTMDKYGAVQTIIGTDPVLKKQVAGTVYQNALEVAKGDGALKLQNASKELSKLPPEIFKDLFGEKSGVVMDYFSVLSKASKKMQTAEDAVKVGTIMRGAVAIMGKMGSFGESKTAEAILDILTKKGKAIEFIKGVPVEKFLKGLPSDLQNEAKPVLERWISKFGDTGAKLGAATSDPTVRDLSSRYVGQQIREKVSDKK